MDKLLRGTLFAVIVLGGGYLVYSFILAPAVPERMGKSITSVSNREAIDTSDWLTFRDEELGVEYKYPNSPCGGEVDIHPIVCITGPMNVDISIITSPYTTADIEISGGHCGRDFEDCIFISGYMLIDDTVETVERTINGNRMVEITGMVTDKLEARSVIVDVGNGVVEIGQDNTTPQINEIADGIASTIRLIR